MLDWGRRGFQQCAPALVQLEVEASDPKPVASCAAWHPQVASRDARRLQEEHHGFSCVRVALQSERQKASKSPRAARTCVVCCNTSVND